MTTRRTLAALAALAVVATAGCNATRRELTVVFDSGATDAQRVSVLHACADATPKATPEPVVSPTPHPGGPRRNVLVVFRIDKANDRDIAHLVQCLQRQPGVKGFQDSAA